MNFKQELQRKTSEIEQIIYSYLGKETGLQKTVIEAMNYSILAGGKRLRPMLMSESYQLFGGKNREVIEPFMAAIEMIHTYSLVHDDLPAMDNDDYRRGKHTTHKKYGEAMGILAGDALLNYAFETATLAFQAQDCPYELVGKALRVLSTKAGIYGMIGGQVVDVENTGKPLDIEKLDFIYALKTGALLQAPMMIGAILAGANDKQLELIEQLAMNVGLAFQIKDDILDETSTMEELGKPIHSDEKNEKTTYVSLFGIDVAQQKVEEYSMKAISSFDQLQLENEYLRELIISLVTRTK